MRVLFRMTMLGAGVVGSILIVGCGGGAPVAAPGEEAVKAAATAIAPASLVEPPAGEAERVRTSEKTGSEAVLVVRSVASPHAPARKWLVTREVFASEAAFKSGQRPSSRREQELVLTDDGSIALARERNFDDNVVVVFEPALVLWPARLEHPTASTEGVEAAPGLSQTLYVKVHPMKDESKIRVEGPATQKIFYESEEIVNVDGQDVKAARIRRVFASDFGATTSLNESVEWLTPGIGIVREVGSERTKVLGVQVRDNSDAWIVPGAKVAERR